MTPTEPKVKISARFVCPWAEQPTEQNTRTQVLPLRYMSEEEFMVLGFAMAESVEEIEQHRIAAIQKYYKERYGRNDRATEAV